MTLVVNANTNANVYNATDEGYKILDHIGTQAGEDYAYVLEDTEEAVVFRSNGDLSEFKALYLNGEKLPEDSYEIEEGSTRITIASQTFDERVEPGANNTIAMEFRDEDNEMHRTAQNFVLKETPTTSETTEPVAPETTTPPTTPTEPTNPQPSAAVSRVIAQIDALPANLTLDDRAAVQAAREAYNALSNTEKQAVTNYARLTAAETRIGQLEIIAADQAAAELVFNLINAIPATITNEAEGAITAARTAYDALTEAQKAYVTNYDRLEAAESALAQYKEQQAQLAADQAAADQVEALIAALPAEVSLEDQEAVENARTQYNALSANQKTYVTNYSTLTAAEDTIAALEEHAAQQAQVNAVIAAIGALPQEITLEQKAAVEAARAAYDALTDEQKEQVVNYTTLESAESSIAALEAQTAADAEDQAAANEVIQQIEALPQEITLTDKEAVEAVRAAYDALSEEQKALVNNYHNLTAAEEAIKTQENYEAANQRDQAAADEVVKKIQALPKEIMLADQAAVQEARAAYDALTETQKAIVINYQVLVEAEVRLAELKDEQEEAEPTVTLVWILVDGNGNALADKQVELHSAVQSGRTDENGSIRFTGVTFGQHMLVVKNENGEVEAQKEFTITQGEKTEIQENGLTAKAGEVVTITVEAEGNQLQFAKVEEGDQTPEVNTDSNQGQQTVPGIDIGQADEKPFGSDAATVPLPTIPQTGDETNIFLWVLLLAASTCGLVTTLVPYNARKTRKH